MFSMICAWINGWINNRETDLRRHHTHYDVTLMALEQILQLKNTWTLSSHNIEWTDYPKRMTWKYSLPPHIPLCFITGPDLVITIAKTKCANLTILGPSLGEMTTNGVTNDDKVVKLTIFGSVYTYECSGTARCWTISRHNTDYRSKHIL